MLVSVRKIIIILKFSSFAESHPLDNLTVKVTLTHCQIGKLSRDQGARHYNFSKHLIFQNISKNCQTALSQPLCFGFSRPGGESEARAREPTQPLFTSLRSHTTERDLRLFTFFSAPAVTGPAPNVWSLNVPGFLHGVVSLSLTAVPKRTRFYASPSNNFRVNE